MLLDTLVQNTTSQSGGSSANNIAHFLTVLVLFVLVLAATYFTTKFVAKTQEGKQKSGNLEVLETIALAPGRFLQIVRIGKKYCAIGVGKEEVSFLTELTEEDFTIAKENGGSFAGILQRMKEKFPGEAGSDQEEAGTEQERLKDDSET